LSIREERQAAESTLRDLHALAEEIVDDTRFTAEEKYAQIFPRLHDEISAQLAVFGLELDWYSGGGPESVDVQTWILRVNDVMKRLFPNVAD